MKDKSDFRKYIEKMMGEKEGIAFYESFDARPYAELQRKVAIITEIVYEEFPKNRWLAENKREFWNIIRYSVMAMEFLDSLTSKKGQNEENK